VIDGALAELSSQAPSMTHAERSTDVSDAGIASRITSVPPARLEVTH
jgi:hypothetical protein